MTLNTSVVIGKPHDVREIYSVCRALLDTPDHVEPIERPANTGGFYRDELASIGHPVGVGLSALLDIRYGVDGPMQHVCGSDCEVDPAGGYPTEADIEETHQWAARSPTQNGWAAIEVTFDTAYGYRGEDGESCSDLHARLVTALGRWLDARGLPWKWQNEYTGDWFDRFDGLAEFGDAHRSTGADAWFRNLVLPAIASEAGR